MEPCLITEHPNGARMLVYPKFGSWASIEIWAIDEKNRPYLQFTVPDVGQKMGFLNGGRGVPLVNKAR